MKYQALILLCAVALTKADYYSQAAAICADEESDGELLSHENCNQFYKCSKGLAAARYCQLNLLYNPSSEQCDWPENIECGDRTIHEDGNGVGGGGGSGGGNTDPSQAGEICAADGSNGVLVAHEQCNQFYKCSEGLPSALYCQLNLLYNADTGQCDWPETVDCGDRIIPSAKIQIAKSNNINRSGNSDPSQAVDICAAEGSDGELVAHENCNQFYKCSEGFAGALYCQMDLLYNIANRQCDWPENVDCGDRKLPGEDGGGNGDGSGPSNGGGNTDPSQAGEICTAEGSDGVLVAHENCNQFYKCSEGLPAALYCQLNLLYNSVNGQCDWPENVNCGDRVVPSAASLNKHLLRAINV